MENIICILFNVGTKNRSILLKIVLSLVVYLQMLFLCLCICSCYFVVIQLASRHPHQLEMINILTNTIHIITNNTTNIS